MQVYLTKQTKLMYTSYDNIYISGSPAKTAPLLEPTAMSTEPSSTPSYIELENSGQIY